MKQKTIAISMIALAVVGLIIGGAGSFFQLFNTNDNTPNTSTETVNKVTNVTFNADTAFTFIQKQCDFGPRVMNTPAHEACKEWIAQAFKAYGCEVSYQEAHNLKGYNGTILRATNIIARYNTDAQQRVLLCAHYDSRPWADNDTNPENHHKPILGANDGASGVAVLLELARILQKAPTLNIGIDFVCFDAEDYGTPQWDNENQDNDTWALGAKYFAENMPLNPVPYQGILLDMVGGQGARFYREMLSMQYAPDLVRSVWQSARNADFGSYFPDTDGGAVTDDHLPLNQIAQLPTIDIIAYYPDCAQSSFGPTWHTLNDDPAHIDRNTLKAVGQTLIQWLYEQ